MNDDQKFETEADYRAGEGKVLFPSTDTREIQIGPEKVLIRPLPAAVQRRIAHLYTQAQEAASNLDAFGSLISRLTKTVAEIAQFYHLSVTEDWIAEHLSPEEMFALINAQLEVGNRNSFLHSLWRSACGPLLEFLTGLGEADLSPIREQGRNFFRDLGAKPSSSPSSASSGEPISPASSSDTPKGS